MFAPQSAGTETLAAVLVVLPPLSSPVLATTTMIAAAISATRTPTAAIARHRRGEDVSRRGAPPTGPPAKPVPAAPPAPPPSPPSRPGGTITTACASAAGGTATG